MASKRVSRPTEKVLALDRARNGKRRGSDDENGENVAKKQRTQNGQPRNTVLANRASDMMNTHKNKPRDSTTPTESGSGSDLAPDPQPSESAESASEEEVEESSDTELGMLILLSVHSLLTRPQERMMIDWKSNIYAFFAPVPDIEYVNGRRCHVFKCLGKHCKHAVRRFLDKADKSSTGNMHKHVKACWGMEVLSSISGACTLESARQGITSYKSNGSIVSALNVKGKVTYSNRQSTKTETRVQIVRWVVENLRPFEIVQDRAFQFLMKTGRPEYYLPHPSTVSRDVKVIFGRARTNIATMLQVSWCHTGCGDVDAYLIRNTTVNLISRQILGRRRTTRRLLHSPSIWLWTVSRVHTSSMWSR